MLENEGLDQALPGINTIQEGVEIYNNLEGYKEKIAKYGIYAIKIKLII